MALTNAGAQEALDGIFGETRYIALFVGTNEVSGNGYARKAVTSSEWSPSANGVYNASEIVFATPSGSWGDVTSIRLYTAATGGSELLREDLSNNPDAITVSGTKVAIPAGSSSTLRFTIALS